MREFKVKAGKVWVDHSATTGIVLLAVQNEKGETGLVAASSALTPQEAREVAACLLAHAASAALREG